MILALGLSEWRRIAEKQTRCLAIKMTTILCHYRCFSAGVVPAKNHRTGELPVAFNYLLAVLSTIGFRTREIQNLKYLAAETGHITHSLASRVSLSFTFMFQFLLKRPKR